ncbi:DUF7619 domain-containing protein [Glaciecola sp. 1036]|uniref:DUF7619 domain-containing protein n=1 Tax=Alteromonadaceae TaxID=72275 RepID=UPI003CFFEAF3
MTKQIYTQTNKSFRARFSIGLAKISKIKTTKNWLQQYLLIAVFLIFLPVSVDARLVFSTSDVAFQNATRTDFNANLGFVFGAQQVQFSLNNVDFNFSTPSPSGLTYPNNRIVSFFPDFITITFSQPLAAVGFQFMFAECQGRARFVGSLGVEDHAIPPGQFNIFVGATDIGDITSVELYNGCALSVWSEMRFAVNPVNPPPTNQADLNIVKLGPSVAGQVNSPIDYDLTVSNSGPDTANGTQIIDFPPLGTSLVNSSPSTALVSNNQTMITMGVGDLANGSQYTNTLTMTLPPFIGSGPVNASSGIFQCNSALLNIAVATSGAIDVDGVSNTDVFITRFDNSSRSGFPEICNNGIDDNCNGRVDCGDNACASAPNCRPPALLNQNNNPPQPCLVVNNVVTCLNNSGPGSFPTGPTPIPSPPPPQACELRDVHGNGIPAPACCCSYGPCDRARCDALLARDPNYKTAVPPVSSQGYGITQAGRLHEYQITYENIGEADAIDVQIYDVLAEELDDTTLIVNNGGSYDPDKRVILWQDPLLPPSEPRTVSFSINAREDLLPGDRIRNKATIIFPNAEQIRTDTNWVEHAIEDPALPNLPDLGVVSCFQQDTSTDDWSVVLYNKGTAFAHNARAQILNPPPGVVVTDASARFGRSDDTDPTVIGTVVPLGSTHSIDPVSFSANTDANICKALTWRISYTTSEGQDLSVDVQVTPDSDADGIADEDDNCPDTANLDQADSDNDGQGDACEVIEPPLVCGDLDGDADVDNIDRGIFMSALRTTAGDANFIEEADYDDDQDIDFSDYQAWYRCYVTFNSTIN